MHQNLHISANIIRMEILNLEVINLDWFFEKLMLNLFDCNVLAVDKL